MGTARHTRSDSLGEVLEIIGTFVGCVASFELELDDLLGLSAARLPDLFQKVPRYPVQISGKIQTLGIISGIVEHDWDSEKFCDICEGVLNLRQLLVHGRLSSIRTERTDTILVMEKMSLPARDNGRQSLQRTTSNLSTEKIWEAISNVEIVEAEVEKLRVAVFRAGEGWPSYMTFPSGKPLSAASILLRKHKLQAQRPS